MARIQSRLLAVRVRDTRFDSLTCSTRGCRLVRPRREHFAHSVLPFGRTFARTLEAPADQLESNQVNKLYCVTKKKLGMFWPSLCLRFFGVSLVNSWCLSVSRILRPMMKSIHFEEDTERKTGKNESTKASEIILLFTSFSRFLQVTRPEALLVRPECIRILLATPTSARQSCWSRASKICPL